MDKNINNNINNNYFNTPMNFNGSIQIATGDIINNDSVYNSPQKAIYTPEPIWRSNLTLAILNWVSVILGCLGLFSASKIVENIMNIFDGKVNSLLNLKFQEHFIVLVALCCLFTFVFRLRKIAEKQVRYPLFWSFAINGYGGRLTLEKIHAEKCPICGGEMIYYNKPIEWINICFNDGSIKRKVTRRSPVLECKREAKHCFEIDPAEDKVK